MHSIHDTEYGSDVMRRLSITKMFYIRNVVVVDDEDDDQCLKILKNERMNEVRNSDQVYNIK